MRSEVTAGFVGREPRPEDPCHCLSGKVAARCCRSTCDWRATGAVTATEGPPTGKSRRRCYAASLLDCSDELDGEHYISEGVLEALGDGPLELTGLPWQQGKMQVLRTGSLTAKVLCHRHNLALSALDGVAARLFR